MQRYKHFSIYAIVEMLMKHKKNMPTFTSKHNVKKHKSNFQTLMKNFCKFFSENIFQLKATNHIFFDAVTH